VSTICKKKIASNDVYPRNASTDVSVRNESKQVKARNNCKDATVGITSEDVL
jgi:hypothetical protein